MIGRNGTTQAPVINPSFRTMAALDMVDATGTFGLYLTSVTVDFYPTAMQSGMPNAMNIRIVKGTSASRTGGNTMTPVVEKDSVAGAFALGQFYCDASADGTNSTTALVHTGTVTAGVGQMFAARSITPGAGYEVSDRMEINFVNDPLRLVAGESIGVINVDSGGKDLNTNSWTVGMRWGVNKL